MSKDWLEDLFIAVVWIASAAAIAIIFSQVAGCAIQSNKNNTRVRIECAKHHVIRDACPA